MSITTNDATICKYTASTIEENVPEGTQEIDLPIVIIQPSSPLRVMDLRELWRYRELLFFLTWRDIKVRYKQSLLGASWAILQPLTMMIVFSLFFGRIGKMPSGDLPYPIFVLAGLLPWFFFSNALGTAQCVVGNQNLVTKIYFPRLLIPMSAIGAGLVDFVIACGLLALMMVVFGIFPSPGIALLPVIVALLLAASLGIGILLSALTVKYRDFRHIVPFMVQLWMFMTPAIYMHGGPSFGPTLQAILPLNPVQGLILNFRVAVLGGEFDFYALTVSGFMSILLLLVGCWYFSRVERSFADLI